jgi:multiple sugar transport system permease protein
MVPLVWIFLTSIKSPPDSISLSAEAGVHADARGLLQPAHTRTRQTPEYIASLPPPKAPAMR